MTKYCKNCGEELIDEAKFCKKCGASIDDVAETNPVPVPQAEEKSYKIHLIFGVILDLLIPILGIIIAIYLLTRKNSEEASKYGKIVLALGIVVWAISFLMMMS